METADVGKKLELEPPGPGPWQYDYSHFDQPLPRYGSDVFCEGFTEGQERGFARAGFPARGIRMVVLDGFPYGQFIPLVGPPPSADAKLPPRWLFKLLGVLHPVLRKRYRVARAYVEGRGWRDDVVRWDNELKPQLVAKLEAISAVAPSELDDEALLEHLDDCREVLRENLHAHFFVNPAAVFPVGRFLLWAGEWTGAETSELVGLVKCGSDLRDPSLIRLIDVLRATGRVDWVCTSTEEPQSLLDQLVESDGDVGAATQVWIARMSVRQVVSLNLSMPNGGEVPELLVAALRQELATDGKSARPSTEEADIRERVPPEHRDRFDELLAEARHVHRLRDERSSTFDVWSMGVLRRALIEVGRRLAARGFLSDGEHVVDLDHHEVVAALRGEPVVSADDVAARTLLRLSRTAEDAPRFLGGEPAPPPPHDYFPPVISEMMRAVFRYLDDMEGTDEPSPSAETSCIAGRPASSGTARGPARLVSGPGDFAKVQPGDILIAKATMPSYNCVLPLLAGIVTDYGGALCHAAIVAREFGIPAVVNTRTATADITDGALIEIDGDQGIVRVLG